MPRLLPLAALLACPLVLVAACDGAPGAAVDGLGRDAAPEPTACADGAQRCDGLALSECRDGDYRELAVCDDACVPGLGCTACVPGEGRCEGEQARVCGEDGQGYELHTCDPVQGLSCDPDVGTCVGACAPQLLGKTYIGCDYLPTVTANGLLGEWDFAVIVSNTGGVDASVRLEGGTLASPQTFTVPANGAVVRRLAYDANLQFCNSNLGDWCTVPAPYGTLVRGGAFRLRSDRPVTVYQFNPLDYLKDGSYSHSNDASLLLPVTSLGDDYVAASWPSWRTPDTYGVVYPGFLAITAARDGTEVTVTTTARSQPVGGTPGTPETVTLDAGDVLELAALGEGADLTGSTVLATGPVQVIGGHFCTNLPAEVPACDHLEEALFPRETLGTRYVVAAPRAGALERAPTVTRIVAVDGPTTLSFDPTPPGARTSLERVGDFVEIHGHDGDFVVTGDARILVMQYMMGQERVGTGDPAMAQAVATDQWRDEYLFHAPVNYEENHATFVAPAGVDVTLDGAPVTGWTPVGTSGYSVARVTLGSGNAGTHAAAGTGRFAVSVYGYGRYTSYWYPGGLDLERIVIE